MKKYIYILALFVGLCFAGCGSNNNSAPPKQPPQGEVTLQDISRQMASRNVSTRLSKGGILHTKGAPSPATVRAMEIGFALIEAKAIAKGYTNKAKASDYEAWVLDAGLSPESQTPCFKVRLNPSDPYYNDPNWSQQDELGKFVYAAEMVYPDGAYNKILVADFEQVGRLNNAADEEAMAQAFSFGGEHSLFKHNDPIEFERTVFHGPGIVHPLIELPRSKGATK